MARLWGWRSPKRGLGLLLTEKGLALAQSQTVVKSGDQHCAWHWHVWSHGQSGEEKIDWPDPAQLRKALARSGFQAQATALSVPEANLQRFMLPLESGLNTRQMHASLAAQLAGLLTTPLNETVWDFQVRTDQAAPDKLPNSQPAWLQAAMQTQSHQSADVLVITRSWVHACEQWCRSAGLQLVRLEPPWQASSRWQLFAQSHPDQASDQVAQALTLQQQAVLGGLALGVVMP